MWTCQGPKVKSAVSLHLYLGDQLNGNVNTENLFAFSPRNPDKGVVINHVGAVYISYLLLPFNRDNISFTLSLDKWSKCVPRSSS